MPSIEESGWPLVFKVSPESLPLETPPHADGEIAIRVKVRALKGMQKEALAHCGPSRNIWRMVSDEGPYLNGTDLAPFPLAFYSAGMAFSFLSELRRHAEAKRICTISLALVQDNFYTMEGSALRGDMQGGALPAEFTVQIAAEASQNTLIEIVRLAEASSPAQAYMRDVLQNTFALHHQSRYVPVTNVRPSPQRNEDPEPSLEQAVPCLDSAFLRDIITKVKIAEVVQGVEGGAGSSLKSEQKRTLHVRCLAQLRNEGLQEAEIQLLKPIGSTFKMVADECGLSAPPALAYLSAGVGFCYMTQLGRYAHIVKMALESYSIVQDNVFSFSGSAHDQNLKAEAKSVDTHLFVRSDGSDRAALKLLQMGEQTCFLHAAMRSSNRSRLRAEINGTLLEIEPVDLSPAKR